MDQALMEALKKPSKAKKVKHLKEFHAREQHDGSYRTEKHSGAPGSMPVEGTSPDLAGVHEQMEDHLGPPNDGEEELGQGQPGMGGQNAA